MNKIRIYGHVDGVNFDQVMEFAETDLSTVNDSLRNAMHDPQRLRFTDTQGRHLFLNFKEAKVSEVRAIALNEGAL